MTVILLELEIPKGSNWSALKRELHLNLLNKVFRGVKHHE